MFLHSWSIALLVCSAASILFGGSAVGTGIRVIGYWDAGADTTRQIDLENRTWLAAMLVEYGLMLQIVSLLLLVLAADSFSQVLVGAMCATGAFLANDFGMPALAVKIFGLFLYGLWVVLNRLDLQSEQMPLTRMKFYYLLLLIPYILADTTLLLLYLGGLQPDIITSCCGVVFGGGGGDGHNLVGSVPATQLMILYYGFAGLLLFAGWRSLRRIGRNASQSEILGSLGLALAWLIFFLFSLLVVTAVISSYIYAMPAHRCPFDILRREYYRVGYPIYFFLFAGTFSGISAGVIASLAGRPGMTGPVATYRRAATRLSLLLMVLFLLVISWFPAAYLASGGEW
jgi:hypothetical protein